MKNLLIALWRALAPLLQSEAGELLSVRRKAHLLEAQRYARLDAAARPPRRPAAPREPLTAHRARGLPTRHAH